MWLWGVVKEAVMVVGRLWCGQDLRYEDICSMRNCLQRRLLGRAVLGGVRKEGIGMIVAGSSRGNGHR